MLRRSRARWGKMRGVSAGLGEGVDRGLVGRVVMTMTRFGGQSGTKMSRSQAFQGAILMHSHHTSVLGKKEELS